MSHGTKIREENKIMQGKKRKSQMLIQISVFDLIKQVALLFQPFQ